MPFSRRVVAVEARKLSKTYPGGVQALRSIDVEVPMGSLFCLAGPNGAGKTTFIRIASTVLRPTAGSVSVMGFDVVSEPWKVRKLVALMPQEGRPFNEVLTVFEAVYYYLLARGHGFSSARSEARRVLEELELWGLRNRYVMSLSGGLRHRTLLAMVLASGADVLFLDEPTTGLDPEARRLTWGYIRRLTREGQTILFSTHQLAEAEAVADGVVLIDNGRVLAQGEPGSLVKSLPYRYKVIASPQTIPEWATGVARIRHYKGLVYIYVDSIDDAIRLASEIVMEGGTAQVKPVDLEDYFMEATRGAS